MFPVAVSLFKSHGVSVLVLKPGGKNVVENISVWKKKTHLCLASFRWQNCALQFAGPDSMMWVIGACARGTLCHKAKRLVLLSPSGHKASPFCCDFLLSECACLFLFPWKGLSWWAYCMQDIEELFWSEFVMLWERVCSLVAQTPPV